MNDNKEGWFISLCSCAGVLILGLIVAKCEHRVNNVRGMIVKEATAIDHTYSNYVALEDRFLSSRFNFTDSTGKYTIGDTLYLHKK